jgi:intracellular sulfur oxidation DsrE/DsrF family protein
MDHTAILRLERTWRFVGRSCKSRITTSDLHLVMQGANMLTGVVVVPAMVIAIEKAQGAGIAYNRQ